MPDPDCPRCHGAGTFLSDLRRRGRAVRVKCDCTFDAFGRPMPAPKHTRPDEYVAARGDGETQEHQRKAETSEQNWPSPTRFDPENRETWPELGVDVLTFGINGGGGFMVSHLDEFEGEFWWLHESRNALRKRP